MPKKNKLDELTESTGATEPNLCRTTVKSEPMDLEAKLRANRLRKRGERQQIVPSPQQLEPSPPDEPGLVEINRFVEVMRCYECGKPIQAKADPDYESHTRVVGRCHYLCGPCTALGIENGTIAPWQVVKLF